MNVLVVTEKCGPIEAQRDGGAKLIATLQKALGESLSVIQFGKIADPLATWHFQYPNELEDRFLRRIANGPFIAKHVQAIQEGFTHILFIHISMQFGLGEYPLDEKIVVWTFPMFLTPSYRASHEVVPKEYFEQERLALRGSNNIITPSYLEKRQLMGVYGVDEGRIHVVPRGIDRSAMDPQMRQFTGTPTFCSIGSIKPQKNTIGLIALFSELKKTYSNASLKVIGAVQNDKYYRDVCDCIKRLKLEGAITLTGYVPPDKLSEAIGDAHLHLSTSHFETFGRAIFESLAMGLPNIARKTGNAAAEFLADVPYARFVDSVRDAPAAVEHMLHHLSDYSEMAKEVGHLFDDAYLAQLLLAVIFQKEKLGVSDFDGTLYHKDDPVKTIASVEAFKKFSKRVVCSARGVEDLLLKLSDLRLEVDWIIAYSGAVVVNGKGEHLWTLPLENEALTTLSGKKITVDNQVIQVAFIESDCKVPIGIRVETYQGLSYGSNWNASKLRSTLRLLDTIQWKGGVSAFGDGPYDRELLSYFGKI